MQAAGGNGPGDGADEGAEQPAEDEGEPFGVGKGPEGKAKTREVKLAALFTQTVLDEEGYPVRDPASTTYLGTFESSDQFGPRVRQAADGRIIQLPSPSENHPPESRGQKVG